MAISTTFTVVAGAILVVLLYRLSKIGHRPAGYPPGPPTIPILGNIHLLPKEKGHLQFQKWAVEYVRKLSALAPLSWALLSYIKSLLKQGLDCRPFSF
jgi:hypothetical protein